MTSDTKPPILHLLFAKNDAIFGHSGARNRRSRLRSATFWLVLASLECAVTDLCNDTSVSHRSRLSSPEWRPRENASLATVKIKAAKKGVPFGPGSPGGPVGIVENHQNIKKFQQYSKAVGGRPARGLRKSFKILARASKILQIPCPGSSGAGWPRARGLPGLQNLVSDDHL